jgi:nucleotide-binding universal stress UspA family protein
LLEIGQEGLQDLLEREGRVFANVIVGVDGRPTGRDAIALGARLAGPDGKLALAHVRGGELRPVHATSPGLSAAEREASHELLERERADAQVEADLVSLVSSSPGRGLHDFAEESGADLLVVGSCSRGLFGRVLLGDDTRGALNGAPCAVAVAVRGYADRPLPLATLGVGYDGSPESHAALALAREIAAQTRAKIAALEVVSLPNYAFVGVVPTAMGTDIDAMVREANERLRAMGDVEGRAVYGLPGEELAAFSADVDLLLVGSRGYGPVKRLVLGSTSEYLERHARSSLLVLRRTTAREGIQIDTEPLSERVPGAAPAAQLATEQATSLPPAQGTASQRAT